MIVDAMPKSQESAKNARKKESYKDFKKKRIIRGFQEKEEPVKNSRKKKNQARTEKYKNIAWRGCSCLTSQDSVYMDLVRKS